MLRGAGSKPVRIGNSKVMAWVAFDRAVEAVELHGLGGDVAKWRALRTQVHAEVCANAVDHRGVFTQSYGGRALDASMPRC